MEIKKIGVVGAGQMGAGIAQVAAVAGYEVVMRDIAQEYVDRGMATITKSLGKFAEKGKISEEDRDAALGRIKGTLELADLKDSDLIVEAVTPSGKQLRLPITSEEDGTVKSMTVWGLRVDAGVFEKVRRDKEVDGIVNQKRVGYKNRGYLKPNYEISTTGGMITEW